MNKISPELERKLTLAVEGMPAFPKSVQKILELTRNLNTDPKELVQVIEKDPVITLKILKVLNSAYFSLPNKITSINHSVVFLGFNTIKNLALSIASVGILPKKNAAHFDVQSYLLHSLTTAGIAKLLCSKLRVPGIDPMDCYIAGLLHDFGKVVFAQFLPEEFRAAMEKARDEGISLHIAEKQIIGADHTVVGSMLAEKWQFSDTLIDCIRNHHSPSDDENAMWASVYAANQISKKMAYGNSGNPCVEELPVAVCNFLGGDIDAIIVSLGGELSKIAEEASLFAQMDSGA
ncbi:MAG: HDOD domain-containing protein [Betaproteobacteria bacterium]|nr:HDOD domain-containing protein [Betaproteobacteria bacterium]